MGFSEARKNVGITQRTVLCQVFRWRDPSTQIKNEGTKLPSLMESTILIQNKAGLQQSGASVMLRSALWSQTAKEFEACANNAIED
jgi:hypothetical protein